MIDILIVSCTQKTKTEFSNTPLGKSIEKLKDIVTSRIFFENSLGISECYNKALQEIYNSKDNIPNYVIFVHDDLWICDHFFKEKLEKGFKQFDVLGLAGARSFSINRGLQNQYGLIGWHLCSPKEHWSGAVEHPYIDGEEGQTYWSYFGPTPMRCATLDGLFLAVNYKKINDNNIKFDEDFKWDFYDLTFCLECNKAGLKLGTTNIACTHMSHGKGILKDYYKQCQNLFIKKWKNS